MRARGSLDLVVVAILTVIAGILAVAGVTTGVVGAIFGLPLVLVLPGYALTAAAFRRGALGLAETLVFSIALSLTLVILSGLLLNWLPGGLRAGAWAALLGAITLGCCGVAFARRWPDTALTWPALTWPRVGLNVRAGLLLGVAALLTTGAVTLSVVSANQQDARDSFTQLWLLPASGQSQSRNRSLQVGVGNMTSASAAYRIEIRVDGKTVRDWPSIPLQPHEQWQTNITVSPPGGGGATQVEAFLYHADTPSVVYRSTQVRLAP
jgi:uncharacterized membrane protein